MVGQGLLFFDDAAVGWRGARRGVEKDVIDHPEIIFGILGVVGERLRDIDLQIRPG